MLRTQIYLPEDLRKKINKARSANESLSNYIRQAAKEKLSKDIKKKQDLKKLADEIFSKPIISKKRAKEWTKEIREDRKLHDERLMKRWDDALKVKKNVPA